MTVAVVGATGYTGRLIVEQAVARGLDVVAVGRDPAKLDALPGDVTARVADARDEDALRAAVGGCRVAVSCVGPFVDLGEPPLRAILAAGAHYLDTTGEQAFMRTVFERYDGIARERGVAAIPAVGFDYVPGDLAAAIAGQEHPGRPHRVDVVYSIRRAKASDGTKRTGLRVMAHPCLVRRGGELREVPVGTDEREYPFPDGPSRVAVWPGGEVLTVPRHTPVQDVTVYMRMPKAMAAIARRARLAEPVARAGGKLVGASTGGPEDDARARARYTVVAEATDGTTTTRCTVEGKDMYGMTAACCIEAMVRMSSPGFDGSGTMATAEAFDPRDFLNSLGDWLTWDVRTV